MTVRMMVQKFAGTVTPVQMDEDVFVADFEDDDEDSFYDGEKFDFIDTGLTVEVPVKRAVRRE